MASSRVGDRRIDSNQKQLRHPIEGLTSPAWPPRRRRSGVGGPRSCSPAGAVRAAMRAGIEARAGAASRVRRGLRRRGARSPARSGQQMGGLKRGQKARGRAVALCSPRCSVPAAAASERPLSTVRHARGEARTIMAASVGSGGGAGCSMMRSRYSTHHTGFSTRSTTGAVVACGRPTPAGEVIRAGWALDDHHAGLAGKLLSKIDGLSTQIHTLSARIEELIAELPDDTQARSVNAGH